MTLRALRTKTLSDILSVDKELANTTFFVDPRIYFAQTNISQCLGLKSASFGTDTHGSLPLMDLQSNPQFPRAFSIDAPLRSSNEPRLSSFLNRSSHNQPSTRRKVTSRAATKDLMSRKSTSSQRASSVYITTSSPR